MPHLLKVQSLYLQNQNIDISGKVVSISISQCFKRIKWNAYFTAMDMNVCLCLWACYMKVHLQDPKLILPLYKFFFPRTSKKSCISNLYAFKLCLAYSRSHYKSCGSSSSPSFLLFFFLYLFILALPEACRIVQQGNQTHTTAVTWATAVATPDP